MSGQSGSGTQREGFDLPSTFDEWPREDQLAYLEHTKSKRELIDSTFGEAGLENAANGSGANPSLKKSDWVDLFLQVRSLRDSEESGSE